jgi:arsenate reductase (thioredoxin)
MVDQSMLDSRIADAAARLNDEFKGIFESETIRRCATDSGRRFHDSSIIEYVPLLVYRFTRERLRAMAQSEGKLTKEQPEVLFVCVHNAGRSQMAAVLTDSMSGGRVHVRSAGSTPASEINPVVVEAMRELGLDLSREFPKPLTDEVVQAADVVVTMGCGDACPLYPGKRYLDWEVDDPAAQPIDEVRRIREDIRLRVAVLLRELGVEPDVGS